jgi:hypothetical protein
MTGIRAFVAHSFAESEKATIRIFVDHFNTLTKSNLGFTWDHAEDAEPSSLSKKVLEKIEGKNVFIGICTKKERILLPGAVSRDWLGRSILNEAQTEWKTSDWIIQEIGLAVGRNMNVIVFLEEGVRKPGGLFGDVEYIEFELSNPHPSFDKLLQMLSAIRQKETITPAGIASVSAETKSVSSGHGKEKATEPEEVIDPQPDWDQDKYDQMVMRAIFMMHDEERVQRIDAAYKASKLAEGENLAIWEARIEHLRLLADQNGDFEKIKSLSKKHPKNCKLLFYIGSGYLAFGEIVMAAHTFEEAGVYV